MKKILLIILILSINIFANNSKHLLDNAIRQNDVQLVYDILQSNLFSAKEKAIYYQLAHDISSIKMQEKFIAAFQIHPLALLCYLTGLGFSAASALFIGLAFTEERNTDKWLPGGIAGVNAFVAFLAFRTMIKIGQRPEIDYHKSLKIKQMILSVDEIQ